MSLEYNPIVRTFNRVRAVLVNQMGVAPQSVRPGVALDALVPAERQHLLMRELNASGFTVPTTDSRPQTADTICLAIMMAVLPMTIIGFTIRSWVAVPIAFLVFAIIVYIGILIDRSKRAAIAEPASPQSEAPPKPETRLARTVGELVIYHTPFNIKGYRYSRNEIALRVKFLVAQRLGVALEHITEDSTFIDMQ